MLHLSAPHRAPGLWSSGKRCAVCYITRRQQWGVIGALYGGTRGNRNGGLLGWEAVGWCGGMVTVGGTGLVGVEGEVRWHGRNRGTASPGGVLLNKE